MVSTDTWAAAPVDLGAAVFVIVITSVFAGTVVGAEIVVPGTVVLISCPLTVAAMVLAAIVVGAVYVTAGMVVVMITMEPSSVAGMALPTPVPVNCGGIDMVDVLGLSDWLFE